ncbi:MAG TPA: DUF1697 domain-containing protein [Saprospiraceae bacterium]|nr:DUF1697 domain-containing protein [Saprospiraceae bacterium]
MIFGRSTQADKSGMDNFIAILRGINVSGKNMIKMPELKTLFAALGFGSVHTYIQSGNVVFSAPAASEAQLVSVIEQSIAERFGYQVPVLIRTAREWSRVLVNNPFLSEKDIDPAFLHVTLLEEAPQPAVVNKLLQYHYEPDRYVIDGRSVYLFCPGGYGNTKLSNAFFENKLKVRATTRNWKTMNEIYQLTLTV